MSNYRALVVTNGDLSDFSKVSLLRKNCDLLIASDGASIKLNKLKIIPDVVIGDFDSSKYHPNGSSSRTAYIKYPRDKDCTDTELAIDYAKSLDYQNIVITGLTGTRVDHMLANIFLIAKTKYKSMRISIAEGDQLIYVARNLTTISGSIGDTISFLPIFGHVKITESSGLQYDLKQYHLSMNGNQGISNMLTQKNVLLKISKGKLLAIHQLHGTHN